MKNEVTFRELRRFLLDIGFKETSVPEAAVFHHKASDTMFVFRPYGPGDSVKAHNLIEVKEMLDSRGLMSADTFENQFKKTPA